MASGLVQLKPLLPAQNVSNSATTAVTVSNLGASTGGKLVIGQAQQTGKVLATTFFSNLNCTKHQIDLYYTEHGISNNGFCESN